MSGKKLPGKPKLPAKKKLQLFYRNIKKRKHETWGSIPLKLLQRRFVMETSGQSPLTACQLILLQKQLCLLTQNNTIITAVYTQR